MSRPGQFIEANDETAMEPVASRLFRLATMALQVMMLTFATVMAGLYVFPLR